MKWYSEKQALTCTEMKWYSDPALDSCAELIISHRKEMVL